MPYPSTPNAVRVLELPPFGIGRWQMHRTRVNFQLSSSSAVSDPVTFRGVIYRVAWKTTTGSTGTFDITLLDDYDVDHFNGDLSNIALGSSHQNMSCQDTHGAVLPLIVPPQLYLRITASDEASLAGQFTVYSRME